MNLSYLKATPIAQPLLLRGRVVKVGNKSTTVACSLWSGDVETARADVIGVRVEG